jgi:hypothetical protein
VLDAVGVEDDAEVVVVPDLNSRMRQGPPHACNVSPGQATAWQTESAAEVPTLPEALSVEPQ